MLSRPGTELARAVAYTYWPDEQSVPELGEPVPCAAGTDSTLGAQRVLGGWEGAQRHQVLGPWMQAELGVPPRTLSTVGLAALSLAVKWWRHPTWLLPPVSLPVL